MKAIMIAAGMGKRLGNHTQDCPKGLLDVNGKPILGYSLEALRANRVEDIAFVKGYQAEKLDFPQTKTYFNPDFQSNNVLCSLMYAEAEMVDSPFIASYSDIIYDASVVQTLLASPHDITIVVDVDWRKQYVGRTAHPEPEADKVDFDDQGRVLHIGKVVDNAIGEFIGLFMCSRQGAKIWRDVFHKAQMEYAGKPFFNAPVFEKALINDMVLYLLSQGVDVHCATIRGNWMEIDTEQDLEKARCWKTSEAVAR